MPESRSTTDFNNPEPREGDLYFFGIGIDKYKIAQRLSSPVRDALAMRDLLTQRFRFDSNSVTLLINEAATREQIVNNLHQYIQTLRHEDSLLIYYSGHSMVDPDSKEGYLVPVEGDPKFKPSLISNRELSNMMESMRCRHVLFICDAQISDRFILSDTLGAAGKPSSEISETPSRMVLAAGGDSTPVSDGFPGSGSPFTQAIIEALTNIKEPATFEAIYHRIDWTDLRPQSRPIYGPIYGAGHRGGSFLFRPREQAKPSENTASSLYPFWEEVKSFYTGTPVESAFSAPSDLLSPTATQRSLPGLDAKHCTTVPHDHLSLVVETSAWLEIGTALGKIR